MVLRSAVRVMVIALGTCFVGLVGTMKGISNLNVTLAVVTRSVLVILLLLAMTWAFRIRDRRVAGPADRSHQEVLIAAALAYFANPFSWGGHTLFGQLLVPPGPLSALVDFGVWMAMAWIGVLLGQRVRVQPTAEPAPYA